MFDQYYLLSKCNPSFSTLYKDIIRTCLSRHWFNADALFAAWKRNMWVRRSDARIYTSIPGRLIYERSFITLPELLKWHIHSREKSAARQKQFSRPRYVAFIAPIISLSLHTYMYMCNVRSRVEREKIRTNFFFFFHPIYASSASRTLSFFTYVYVIRFPAISHTEPTIRWKKLNSFARNMKENSASPSLYALEAFHFISFSLFGTFHYSLLPYIAARRRYRRFKLGAIIKVLWIENIKRA